MANPARLPAIFFGHGNPMNAIMENPWSSQWAALAAEMLIMGSGNLVHNLHTYAWGEHDVQPYDWVLRFEAQARESMLAGDFQPLIEYENLGRDAMLCAPTPDHYLPLLYVLAQHRPGESISFPVEGFDGGSMSMLTVKVG